MRARSLRMFLTALGTVLWATASGALDEVSETLEQTGQGLKAARVYDCEDGSGRKVAEERLYRYGDGQRCDVWIDGALRLERANLFLTAGMQAWQRAMREACEGPASPAQPANQRPADERPTKGRDPGARATRARVDGTYQSSWGQLVLQQKGDQVSGQYGSENGEITGQLSGTEVEGYWIEDESNTRCQEARRGRYYWGRVQLQFAPDFAGFQGSWGYCDGNLDRSDWTGTREGGATPAPEPEPEPAVSVAGTWDSTWGELTLKQDGDAVAGRYATDNGEIVGRIAGRALEGYWIEDNAGVRCDAARNGRYYWGRVHLELSDDLSTFKGPWGYCDGAMDQSDWSGTRR
ncbi:MAG: hypothetical protein ABIL09_00340 [Gemmatimonadota bacterium]